MDPLIALPLSHENSIDQDEDYVLRTYFKSGDAPLEKSLSWFDAIKLAVLGTVLLLLLFNPFTQRALGYLPYVGDNDMIGMVAKAVIFFILLTLASKFLV